MTRVFAALIFLAAMAFAACKKSTTEDDKPTPGETKPEFDNTNFGVYRGILIGSAGTVVFRVRNGDNNVSAYLEIRFPEVYQTLTTTTQVNLNQPINNIVFTGTSNPAISLRLTADANGGNPKISDIKIPGHTNVDGFVFKEKSSNIVFAYNGSTTSGNPSATVSVAAAINGNIRNGAPMQILARNSMDTISTFRASVVAPGYDKTEVYKLTSNLGQEMFLQLHNPTFPIRVRSSGDGPNYFKTKWSWTNDFSGSTEFEIK